MDGLYIYMESPPQKRIGGTPISGNLIESNNESNNKWDINKSMGARRYITMINNNKGNNKLVNRDIDGII